MPLDGSGGVRNLGDDGDTRLRRTPQLSEHFIGIGLQGVAGKNGSSFAECFVARRPPAAKIVIVERGKVVVDQRVGVKHFQRRS